MVIEEDSKTPEHKDHRKAFTLDTMPAELEEALLALADNYDQDGDDG